MDKIKFRGKRLDNGEWVYGSLVKGLEVDCDAVTWWIFEDTTVHIARVRNYQHEVDLATIGQFTGLYDAGNARIWEDDIVDCSYANPMTGDMVKVLHVVTFSNAIFWAKPVGSNSPYSGTLLHFVTERKIDNKRYASVIGNIHDNPELLDV